MQQNFVPDPELLLFKKDENDAQHLFTIKTCHYQTKLEFKPNEFVFVPRVKF